MFVFKSNYSNFQHYDVPLFVAFKKKVDVDGVIQTPTMSNFNSLSIKRHRSGVGMDLIKGKSSLMIRGGINHFNRRVYYKRYYMDKQ